MAKKYTSPDLFKYYAYGKGSGVKNYSSPDLFKEYSGVSFGDVLNKQEEERRLNELTKNPLEEKQHDIENDKMRLNAAGVDTKPKQSAFGKWANLDPKNKWYQDFGDLIHRPQNAVQNVLINLHKNSDKGILESAKEGISGDVQRTGSDMLSELGWKKTKENSEPNTVQNILGKSGALGILPMVDKETRTARGMTSFGVDMLTDPLNLIGVGEAKTAAKGVSKLVKPVKNSLEALEKTKAVSAVKDFVGPIFKQHSGLDTALDGSKNTKAMELFKEADKEAKAMNSKLEESINYSAKNLDDVNQGKEAARIVEDPLEQKLTHKAWMMPDGSVTKNFDDVKAIQSELKQNVADKTKAIKDLDTTHFKATNELKKQATNLEKQIQKIEKDTKSQLLKTHEITSLDDTVENMSKGGFIKNILNENQIVQRGKDMLKKNPEYQKLMQERANIGVQIEKLANKNQLERNKLLEELDAHKTDHEAFSALKKSEPNHSLEEVYPRERVGEVSSDPKAQILAKNMSELSNEVADHAIESGVPLTKMEKGHMYHAITDEQAAYKKLNGGANSTSFQNGVTPKDKIVGGRNLEKYHGSAEEVNARLAKEGEPPMFEENILNATAKGAQKTINLASQHKKIQILQDPAFAKYYGDKPVKPEELLPHQTVINTNEFHNTFKDPETGESVFQNIPSGNYVVPKSLKRGLENMKKIHSDEGSKNFWSGFDFLQNTFKKVAIGNPGYNVKNGIDNYTRMYISGMDPFTAAKDFSNSIIDLTSLKKNILPKVYGGEKLTSKEERLLKEYRLFQQEGLGESSAFKHEVNKKGTSKTIEKIVKDAKKSPIKKLGDKAVHFFNTNIEVGGHIDDAARFALFRWNLKKGLKAGLSEKEALNQAREQVIFNMFDYSDLTTAEKSIFKRLYPFYAFMRKSLVYNLKTVSNPAKWSKINGINNFVNEMYENNDMKKDDVNDYNVNSYDIPIAKNQLLKTNLSIGDLNKGPSEYLIDSLTPGIKLPIETGKNINLFTGQPLEKFEGQKKDMNIPFTDTKIPLSPKIAQILNSAGPLRYTLGNRGADSSPIKDFLTKSVYTDIDPEKVKLNKAYNEEKRLQDLMKKYEQDTGNKVPTVKELKKWLIGQGL